MRSVTKIALWSVLPAAFLVSVSCGSSNDSGAGPQESPDGSTLEGGGDGNGSSPEGGGGPEGPDGSGGDGGNPDGGPVGKSPAGTLDTTFGTGGVVQRPSGSSQNQGVSVLRQSDGKILVVTSDQ